MSISEELQNTGYLFSNAKILMAAAEYDSALILLKTIVRAGKKNSEVCLAIGKCYESLSKDQLAQEYYEESIAFSASLEAYQKLANIWLKAGAYSEAAKIFGRASASKLNLDVQSRLELMQAAGNCLAKSGNYAAAVEQYVCALDLDPKSDTVCSNVGVLNLHQGRIKEAKSYFSDALSGNPKNAKALFGMAQACLNEGNKIQAHDYFIRSLNENIQQSDALYQLVKLSFELKSYVSAVRLLQEYAEVSPINTHVLYVLAGMQFFLRRFLESKSTLNKILELQPDHAGARELLKHIESEPSWRTFNHGIEPRAEGHRSPN